jgi:dienelactone hydrolase
VDLLQQQPGAGNVPLAIVGHDYGGMYSIVAAAEDHRAKTCVFVACTPSFIDWAFYTQKPVSVDAYRQQNAPLDLSAHVARLAGTLLLFQFAEHDGYIPLAKAQELFSAAKEPKQMIVYGGATHEMTKPASIREDRDAWLVRELELEKR